MKKEEEYGFWIFDLRCDIKFKRYLKNSKYEKFKSQIYFYAYLLQIAGAFVHIFAIGDFSSQSDGQFILKIALFVSVGLFGFLNAVAMIKIFTLLRKSSSILTFHEKDDEIGERHLQEFKHERQGQENKNDIKHIHDNQDFDQQLSQGIHTKNNESVVIHNSKEDGNHSSTNNRMGYHKRASVVRKSILAGQGVNLQLNIHSKVYHQFNNFNSNKDNLSWLNLLKFIGLFNMLLIITLGHLMSVFALILKVTPYYEHRILLTLQIFQAIPNGIFTSLVGFNIIFNIIFDLPFLKNLLRFKELQIYIKQLAKTSGYFFFYLVSIACLVGSVVTLSVQNNIDTASIFLIILFSLYYTYELLLYLNKKYF